MTAATLTAAPAAPDALDLALAAAARDRELAREAGPPAKPWSDGQLAKAFGEGADARLYGWAVCDNPYESWTVDWTWWNRGWHDVDNHWGEMVRSRWALRTLPPSTEAGCGPGPPSGRRAGRCAAPV